jgi:methylated-DNA-[protein]-cysteine S-methyltransferase
VRTYAWVADGIGCPGAQRAVGQALSRNPLPIFRDCHRVVATDGLGGYGGGGGLKERLRELEGVPWSLVNPRSK